MQRFPEAEGTVAGGERRRDREAVPVAQAKEQLAPALRALAVAVLERQELLPAIGVGADEHQHARPVVLQARCEVDAIGPEVDVAVGAEITVLPALVLLLPGHHQPAYRRRREAGRVGT